MIELKINGTDIAVEPDTTIFEAASQSGIYIPNLCLDRRLKPYGGCRLCLVEVEGNPKLMASCSTPAQPGMVVSTESDKLSKARKTVLELLLVHHPLDCPICDKAGECDLQDLAFKYGPTASRFTGERKHEPASTAAPLVERNPNRCILCGKCVRVCGDHQGVSAINLLGRGFESKVSPAFEETLDCEFCGQCIDVCPVGALGSKPYKFRSRVWFMEEKNTVCPYCGCGCTVTLGIAEEQIVRSRGIEGVGISKGDLCGKGRFGLDFVHSEKRLKTPLIRKDDELVQVGWEEAITYIGQRLTEIKDEYGPGAIGAIGSESLSVEDNYMLQKFMRQALGTGNVDSFARFGYARAQEAVRGVMGLDTLPISFDSPLGADVILVVGSDITSTHPVFGLNILKAKLMNGAKLIVADPRSTKLTRHSTEWLRINPGTCTAFMCGIMRVMLDEDLHKAGGIDGLDEFTASLSGTSVEAAAEACGISADALRTVARDLSGAESGLICLTMGNTENTKSLSSAVAAADLAVLTGGGPGALQIPAEYSNTLGMYEAGVRPDFGPGHEPVEVKGLDLLGMLYDDASPIRALYVMGENVLASFPRAGVIERKLKDLDFLVVQDINLHDTAAIADVVLPAASWSEKDGTFVGATGVPQRALKYLPETGQSVPDWMILRNIARAMHMDIGAQDIEVLRAEIAGKVKFEFSTAGYSPKLLPVLDEPGEATDEQYPLLMATGNLMQHSGSLTTLSRSLGTVVSDAYLQINPADAERCGVKPEGFVKATSRRGEAYLKARITDEVPEGMLFVPAHFPHARINILTYPSEGGGTSVVAVKVEPAGNV